jgi:2-phospho-L-lactate guanylyltransferase
MTLWAVVPVKALHAAKGRLAPLLSPAERASLAGALLEDVLAALCAASDIERVLVISADPAALELAELLGAVPLPEPPTLLERPAGGGEAALNAALDHAAALATHGGASGLLALAADVPLVTPADIVALAAAPAPPPSAVLVPTPDGGTSALLRRPPLALPAQFGPNSLQAHLRAAAAHGVTARLLWRPTLTLDVDRPADLRRLAALAPRSRAQALLAAWGVATRDDVPARQVTRA